MKNKTRVVCMKILAQMLMECSFSTSVHLAHRIRRGIGARNFNCDIQKFLQKKVRLTPFMYYCMPFV